MYTWPVISPWLLGAGLIGFAPALVALRVRQRWLMAIALLLLIGPVLVCGSYWGLLDLKWTDYLLVRTQVVTRRMVAPNTEVNAVLSGTMPETDFANLIRASILSQSSFATSQLSSIVGARDLPIRYHDVLVETALAEYAKTNTVPAGDEYIFVTFASLKGLSDGTRAKLLDFMIANRSLRGGMLEHGGRSSASWLAPLYNSLFKGQLSDKQRAAFLESIARPVVTRSHADQPVAPGEVFSIEVQMLSSVDNPWAYVPWTSTFELDTGPFTVVSKPPPFDRDFRGRVVWLRAPDTIPDPSLLVIRASGRATLTRDQIYRNKDSPTLSEAVSIHAIDDIVASSLITMPVAMAPNQEQPPQVEFTNAEVIGQRISQVGQGSLWRVKGKDDIGFFVKVDSPDVSMAFDATFVDGPMLYPMGRHVALEGIATTWRLLAADVPESPYDSYILLTPCPEVLRGTPTSKTIYTGPAIAISDIVIVLRENIP